MAPFRIAFKHTIGLASTLPSSILTLQQGFGLLDLHRRSVTRFVNNLNNLLSLDSSHVLSQVLSHRLFSLQTSINIPHSPLHLREFSAFTSCLDFRTDYIFRFLYFSSLFHIYFSSATLLPLNCHSPIYRFFASAPALYSSQLRLFQKHRIMRLVDCISPDGLALAPYSNIIHANSLYSAAHKPPRWYPHLLCTTAVSSTSRRLRPELQCSPSSSNVIPARSTDLSLEVLSPTGSQPFSRDVWGAVWDSVANIPIFGRFIKSASQDVFIQHWRRVISTVPPSSSTASSSVVLSPTSRLLTLIECQGCTLHDPLAHGPTHGNRLDSRLQGLPCLFKRPHAECVSLKALKDGKFDRSRVMQIHANYFQLDSALRSVLSASNSPLLLLVLLAMFFLMLNFIGGFALSFSFTRTLHISRFLMLHGTF